MKYDFTTKLERNGMDAIAVDGIGISEMAPKAPKYGYDVIPMWVADMNFVGFPGVTESILKRANHPSYGYFMPRKEYYDAIIYWHEKRKGIKGLTRKNIGYENGVLGGVISALNVICSKGDNVLIHSPTYIGFTHALENNGYNMIHSTLKLDDQGVWRMDFDEMERLIRREKIHALLFCSPHNPCGRVWEKDELTKLSDLCEKYDITVISDEIWSDIIMGGYKHIPLQSVSEYLYENTIALYAPSKTFNLAGLVGSYHIIYNKRLKERIEKEASLSAYNSMNVLSMYALIGAYTDEGMAWVDELNLVIEENTRVMLSFFNNVGDIFSAKPQGTYMLFVDLTKWLKTNKMTIDKFEKACWDVGVAVQDGKMFHGNHHVRVNLALPTAYIKEACNRLEKCVF